MIAVLENDDGLVGFLTRRLRFKRGFCEADRNVATVDTEDSSDCQHD